MHQPPAAPPAVRPWQVTTARAFPAVPGQVSAARRFLAALIEGFPAAEDALLCLSEVVTNAIQHSRSARPGWPVHRPRHLRPRPPARRSPRRRRPLAGTLTHHDHGGHGLAILTALTRWDITETDGHRIVWFEITT